MTDPTKVQVWMELTREEADQLYQTVLGQPWPAGALLNAIDRGRAKLDARERLVEIEAQLKALQTEAGTLRDLLNR